MSEKKLTSDVKIVLMQDIGLSLLGSLLSLLAIRWLSEPHPGFTLELAKWLLGSAVATLAGIFITGSHKLVRAYISAAAGLKLVNLVAIKEALMVVLLLTGLVFVEGFSMGVLLVVLDLVFTLFFLLYLRYIYARISRESHSVKDLASRKTALVAGTGEDSVALAMSLESSGEFHVLGFISSDPGQAGLVIREKVVYKCTCIDDLNALRWRFGGVDCIFFGKNADDFSSGDGDKKKEEAQGNDFVSHSDGMSRAGHFVKRTFDIGLSAVLLVLFSPVMLICAIAVRIEDGGPSIYSQERIGKKGRPFMIYKFRSMRKDAEKDGAPALYSGEEDPRLTRVGAFLRAHHLDELPQLWNVFTGDMSFIGYRPERQFYIDQIVERNPRYRYLYQIRPGVTSYATLYNSYTDTLEKMLTRLDLDLYYLRNHSISFDLRVLWLTFFNIVVGKKF